MSAESNRERFIRLAEARVNKVIKGIRLIGNLSNRNNYSYDQEDVEKIFKVLKSELDFARMRFSDEASKQQSAFRLKTRKGSKQ